MGGGGGGSLAGGGAESVATNMAALKSDFPVTTSGYFGKASPKGNVRLIESDNPLATAKKFYEIAARQGKELGTQKAGVRIVKFKDGSIFVFRIKSFSDGSPVVTVTLNGNFHGVKSSQKIHFVGKGN